MPLYMTQFSYTSDAWAAIVRRPQDRAAAFRALLEQLGGKLIFYAYALGDYDGVAIYEAPNETAATASLLSVLSVGHVKALKTTALLSVEQVLEAAQLADRQAFHGPGGWGDPPYGPG
jgi:uncharacterized protein with GYD domain